MELKIYRDKNLAYIRITGFVIPETILNAFDKTVSHPQYRKGMGRLWDFTEADPSSLETEAITGIREYSLKFPSGINDVKVAIVSAKDLGFGLARMFEITTRAKTPISVFRTVEEAEDWLLEKEKSEALVA